MRKQLIVYVMLLACIAWFGCYHVHHHKTSPRHIRLPVSTIEVHHAKDIKPYSPMDHWLLLLQPTTKMMDVVILSIVGFFIPLTILAIAMVVSINAASLIHIANMHKFEFFRILLVAWTCFPHLHHPPIIPLPLSPPNPPHPPIIPAPSPPPIGHEILSRESWVQVQLDLFRKGISNKSYVCYCPACVERSTSMMCPGGESMNKVMLFMRYTKHYI